MQYTQQLFFQVIRKLKRLTLLTYTLKCWDSRLQNVTGTVSLGRQSKHLVTSDKATRTSVGDVGQSHKDSSVGDVGQSHKDNSAEDVGQSHMDSSAGDVGQSHKDNSAEDVGQSHED